MTLAAHGFATALYLFAAFLGWTRRSAGNAKRRVPYVIALAALIHAAGIWALHVAQPAVPLSSFPAALSMIGWLTALAWLAVLRNVRLRGAGPWVGSVAAAFTLMAEIGLQIAAPALEAEGESVAWSHAHVLLGTSGFALLALSSMAGLGYLAKERVAEAEARLRALAPGAREPRSRRAPDARARLRAAHARRGDRLRLGREPGELTRGRGTPSSCSRHGACTCCPSARAIVRQQQGPAPARGVVWSFAFLAFSYIGIRVIGANAFESVPRRDELSHRAGRRARALRRPGRRSSSSATRSSLRSVSLDEGAILSTCNRTELIGASRAGDAALERMHRFLREELGDGSASASHVYELRDGDVVRHVFRVAGGLDSMVLGEAQILGQLKLAYRAAVEARSTGPVLNRLFQHAFHAAKRIRSETGLGAATVSVARVGVQLVGEVFESFAGKRVLLVGAGEMAESALLGPARGRRDGSVRRESNACRGGRARGAARRQRTTARRARPRSSRAPTSRSRRCRSTGR